MGLEFIRTTNAEIADTPLSQAVRAGDFLFVSGQVGRRASGEWALETLESQTRVTLQNVQAIVEAAGGSLRSICKVQTFLADAADYEEYNEIYREVFPAPCPARSTIVTQLVRPELRIEIEAIAYLGADEPQA